MISNADYAYWEAAVADPSTHKEFPLNMPVPGFYRLRTRDGEIGVAIWPEDGEGGPAVTQRGKSPAKTLRTEAEAEDFCHATIKFCKAVTHEAYQQWYDTGVWPDQVMEPGRNAQLAEHIQIRESIQEIERELEAWFKSIGGKIETQAHADKAANWKDLIHRLSKEAEEKRKAEKKPHWDAGVAVDDKWAGVTALGSTVKRKIANIVEPFLRAEQARKLREAAAKMEAGQGVRPEDVKAKAGTTGRATTMRVEQVLRITDEAAFKAYYKEQDVFWRDPRTYSVLASIAKADLKAGMQIPGAKLVDEGKAQ